MMTINQSLQRLIQGSAIALFLFIPCNPVLAQITPDSTLGAEGSSILPNGVVIDGVTADLIKDGASRGSALFHSFLEFNINQGQRVYFANPDGIEAIFSRVTGTDPSDILGTLGVNGAADLIFINPNGILFGENAQLDIRGSFIGSTANGVIFENGTIFSATNPEAPPLLTINVPLGLQYGNQNSAAITNSGSLQVGKNLTLVGGTITSLGQLAAPAGHLEIAAVNGDAIVRDGLAQSAILFANNHLILEESQLVTAGDLILLSGDTVRVRDSVEIPFIAHAGGNLYIQGNQSIDILALNHPGTPFQSGGALSLVSDGVISGDAHFASGGQFAILNLAGEPGDFVSYYDPIISVDGDVIIGDYTGASLLIEATGSIKTGNITITQADISLNDTNDPTDSDIAILTSEPALIMRSGVDTLKYPVTPPISPQPPQPPPTNSTFEYENDFEGAVGSEWSNTKTDQTPDEGTIDTTFLGLFGQETVSLTLNDLPSPANVTGSFDLFIIGSWDGNDTSAISGPDVWQLRIDDNVWVNATFSNVNSKQSFPDDYLQGEHPSHQSADHIDELGYTSSTIPDLTFGDSIYTIEFSLEHTSNSLQIDFSKLPPGEVLENENWGIDDIEVVAEVSSTPPVTPPDNSSTLPSFTTSVKPSDASITTVNIETLGGRVILDATSDINLIGGITSNGGEISIHSDSAVNATGVIIDSTNNEGTGNSGNIDVTAQSVSLADGARLLSRVVGNNQGGNITVKASESVNLTDSLPEGNSTGLFATSDGSGEPGNVFVETPELNLQGRARILTEAYDIGNAGELRIETDRLSLQGGARVSALTSGQGKGGNIIVEATESVQLIGSDGTFPSALTTNALTNGLFKPGDAGNLTINTNQLIVQDGAIVTASTTTTGEGGDLTVNASTVQLSGTGILNNGDEIPTGLFTDTSNIGNAGDLTINTTNLIVEDGAIASASTFGQDSQGSQGGNLIVNAVSVELRGRSDRGLSSGLYAQTFGTGQAGNLTINTQDLIVQEQARVTVAAGGATQVRVPAIPAVLLDILSNLEIPPISQATGDAGNIGITANKIILDQQGTIIAETEATEGGNITLNVNDILLLRHNSSISTTAGTAQAGGNGGNIRINSPFIVGLPWENSDITANAFFGNGGRVDITTNKIYGLEFRPRLTPLSDITASSEFGEQGVVELNTLEIDPNTGLLQLPPPASPPEFVNFCQGDSDQTPSHFIISGRGGVPPTISQVTGTDNVWEDLRPLTPSSNSRPAKIEPVTQTRSTPIIEAQGWIKLPDGTIVLTAEAPNVTPNTGWQNPIHCQSAFE
ncbi:two-partner secretion domain-containing protein [Coleofasciculus chthonoplastes]|uniref:two-partner secretion domain-containing protein n=2 Tax=Coleofasciculus chthonoplastes TaxID=64178 RepID=UPI0033038B03